MIDKKEYCPVLFMRLDYCPNCKQNRIELFSYFNYPQGYKKIADAYQKGEPIPLILDKYDIYTMRCRACGKEYGIRWDNDLPMPVYGYGQQLINLFIQRYLNMK